MTHERERMLPDDYPIYGDYLYVVDGEVYRSDYHGITAGELKRRLGAKEIRNCDIYERRRAALAAAHDTKQQDGAGNI